MANLRQCINTPRFSFTVNRLRQFFLNRGFVEAHPQSRLSILAACEDPTTLRTFQYSDSVGEQTWPLPQTGQMWLEHELLKDPGLPGVFCVSTSYRQEPNPVPGRHLTIFPMFEFELHGGIDDMEALETDLLLSLGYALPGSSTKFNGGEYTELCWKYGVNELDNEHEADMCRDEPVFFLKNFPEHTAPFWNMARYPAESPGIPNTVDELLGAETAEISKKIDVILSGQETIGSAERSCDPEQMHRDFHEISDGEYAELLYRLFGRDRVQRELDQFLSYDFFPRSGGGIGVTRLMRSMDLCDLIPPENR